MGGDVCLLMGFYGNLTVLKPFYFIIISILSERQEK